MTSNEIISQSKFHKHSQAYKHSKAHKYKNLRLDGTFENLIYCGGNCFCCITLSTFQTDLYYDTLSSYMNIFVRSLGVPLIWAVEQWYALPNLTKLFFYFWSFWAGSYWCLLNVIINMSGGEKIEFWKWISPLNCSYWWYPIISLIMLFNQNLLVNRITYILLGFEIRKLPH